MNLVYVDIGWPLLANDTYFTCISHSYLSLYGRQKKPLNMRFFSIASGKEQMFRKIIFVTLFLMWNHFFMSIIPPDLLAFLYCHLDRKLSEMKTSFFVFPMAYYKPSKNLIRWFSEYYATRNHLMVMCAPLFSWEINEWKDLLKNKNFIG